MIAPMKKVTIVMQKQNNRELISKLRDLGLVHLEKLTGSGSSYENTVTQKNILEKAVQILSQVKKQKGVSKQPVGNPLAIATEIVQLYDKSKTIQTESNTLIKEIERIRNWNDFETSSLLELQKKGISIRLFEVNRKKLKDISPEITWITLFSKKNDTYIALIGDGILPDGAREFIPCTSSLTKVRALIIQKAEEYANTLNAIKDYLYCLDALILAHKLYEQELVFETTVSGMAQDGELTYVQGYLPEADVKKLKTLAEANHCAVLYEDPRDDEVPPTKVINNPITRIIAPVFDFLGTVPNYREYDTSFWFMIFFVIFFAMIFGDGGYGALLLVISVFLIVGTKLKIGKVPDAVRLLFVLSLATIFWGVVTGSWFGLPYEVLPGILQKAIVPEFLGSNPESSNNIKVFCFVLGLIQLSIAHIKNIIRDFPNPKFIGQIGSLCLVSGMFVFVLNLVIDPIKYPIPSWALPLLGVGFLLVFIFSNWTGKIGSSLGEAFKNVIPLVLGVVSVFADIVSYIRLWAVGLAGVAISQTVNGMGGGLFSVAFLIIAGAAILLVGHTLNVVMSVLSVIVHGVRLNMLEFSSHLGMEWSGYKYEPFKKTVDKDIQSLKENVV